MNVELHSPEGDTVNKASQEFIIGHLTFLNFHSLNDMRYTDQTWAQVSIQVFIWMLVGLACGFTCHTQDMWMWQFFL